MDDFITNFSYEEIEDAYYGYEDWYDVEASILEDLKSEIQNSDI